MTISTHFQDEIDAVDPTKVLVFHTDQAGYGDLEWSYDGLNVYGGSDLACEHGASALLHAMGFRFFAPNETYFYVRPSSIQTSLSAPQQEYWMPDNRIWLAYGHSWAGVNAASRTTLGNAMAKWQILNGVYSQTRPAGHRWDNIINNNAAWFAANPQVLSDANSFDLATLQDAVDQTDYNNLVMICAAEILSAGFNAFNRTNFDPSDGDTNPSDRVFPFTKAVIDQVRAGTSAIGTHPARAGNPTAEIGLYAYAGHRPPPTDSVRPGVYTQVALGFNSTNLTYTELVEQHGAKADAVLLREYLDTQVWSQSNPFSARVAVRGYGDASYDAYQAAGAVGANCEFAANWLNTIVGLYAYIRKIKTGSYDFDAARDEIVSDVFGNDPAVADLYDLYGNSRESFHKWNLKRVFDIISRMQDSWYKTLFKYYAVIIYEQLYLPDQTPLIEQDASDPFPAAFSKFMSHVVAVRDYDVIHSYAIMRQQANAKVSTNYKDLQYSSSPAPDYFTNPYLPTDYDFNKAHAVLSADTERDADLDSEDLVLVQGITPNYSAAAGTQFYCEGLARYIYIGPGTVTFTEEFDPDASTSQDFDVGVHVIYVSGAFYAEPSGGLLFLDAFPAVRIDGGGNMWLFVPTRCEGETRITSGSRIVINDGTGEVDILPGTDPSVSAGLAVGQNYIKPSETRGTHSILNGNRYISLSPTSMLMPRVIAEEQFPNLIQARLVGSIPDTTDPTTPGTPTVSAQTDTSIGIVWAASSDNSALTYLVYRDNALVGSSKEPAFIDTGLTPETTYTYKVVAKDVVGNLSSASGTVDGTTTAADTTAPTVPSNLAVTATTQSTVSLSWSASTDAIAVAGYRIYRDSTLIATRANTRFTDTGLAAATQYVYTVSAYDDANNESAQSASVSPTTDAADTEAPTTPANLAVTLETVSTVALDWDASTDNVAVSGYRVYQYDPVLDDYEVVLTTAAGTTAGTVAGLESGLTYSFKVSAFDAAGNESALSAAVEATTT